MSSSPEISAKTLPLRMKTQHDEHNSSPGYTAKTINLALVKAQGEWLKTQRRCNHPGWILALASAKGGHRPIALHEDRHTPLVTRRDRSVPHNSLQRWVFDGILDLTVVVYL